MTSTAVTPPDSRAERVSGMDAWQLYQETRLQVGNGMSLILVDRSSVIGDLREYVVSALNNRMHLMPAYRKVLYDPWFNPDRPMLVARPEIDVSAHVTALPMPAPGGAVGAAKALAQVRAMHLNRREPLWHMYVLDDEDTERSYLISVVHHLLVDGDSTMEVVGCLMTPGDLSARPPKPIPASSTFPARPSAVVRDALARKGNRLRRLPRLETTFSAYRAQQVGGPPPGRQGAQDSPELLVVGILDRGGGRSTDRRSADGGRKALGHHQSRPAQLCGRGTERGSAPTGGASRRAVGRGRTVCDARCRHLRLCHRRCRDHHRAASQSPHHRRRPGAAPARGRRTCPRRESGAGTARCQPVPAVERVRPGPGG
ncbi:hypothetical protein H7I76_37320 [Mycolicibacterium vaccae]|nr:hypothetical protein [Mycolicibacterium vaccae]